MGSYCNHVSALKQGGSQVLGFCVGIVEMGSKFSF